MWRTNSFTNLFVFPTKMANLDTRCVPKHQGTLQMGMTHEDRRRLKGGCAVIEPIAAPIPDACRLSGLSRSEILGDWRIQAIKSGARTLIMVDSLRAYLASLPKAIFRAPKPAVQQRLPEY
jgi:hypothetical protein